MNEMLLQNFGRLKVLEVVPIVEAKRLDMEETLMQNLRKSKVPKMLAVVDCSEARVLEMEENLMQNLMTSKVPKVLAEVDCNGVREVDMEETLMQNLRKSKVLEVVAIVEAKTLDKGETLMANLRDLKVWTQTVVAERGETAFLRAEAEERLVEVHLAGNSRTLEVREVAAVIVKTRRVLDLAEEMVLEGEEHREVAVEARGGMEPPAVVI